MFPKGKELDEVLNGPWERFEEWIRKTIGGNFTWSLRPFDSPENRQMVMDAIVDEIKRKGGTFPKKGPWVERLEK
jgi:hypothetical protein